MSSNSSINFLYFDIYSKRITFFFNNREKISSYFGLFLTLTYIIVSLILFVFYFVSTIRRTEIKVYDSTEYAENTPSLEVDTSLIYFAFGVEDYKSSSRFIDETIYYPKVLYISRDKINGKFVTKINRELPYERCKEEKFGQNYKNFFYEGELNSSYCLQNFNLTLAGGFKYDKLSYIRLKIFPCVNTTENNNHCKPKEIINQYLSGAALSLIIKDVGLNPSNFSNPFLPTIQDLYTTIDKKYFRDFILYFGVTEIQSDKGFFYEILQKDKILRFRKSQQTFYLRDEKEYENGKEICVIQIRLDDNIAIQKRTYMKLPEVFSKIGGYMQLISTIFSILSIIVNRIGPEIKILNGIFNFNIKKNKMIMKIHSLRDFNLITFSNNSNIFSSKLEKKKGKKNNNIKEYKELNTKSKKEDLTDDKNESMLPITIVNNKYDANSQIKKYNKNKDEKLKESLVLNKANKNFKKRSLTMYDESFEKECEKREIKASINFNLCDYYCLRRLTSKIQEIELFKKGSSLYRKRMDIINVFTLLLLTEKKLLNHENKKYQIKGIDNTILSK